ncbi:MAG: histidine kinase dimerization/phospho-acceptor domain-containing protein, partial [Candidatus Rokuibacteriota bacterium]
MKKPLATQGRPDTFLAGGGEMGALMRGLDWARTPLGPPDLWPQSLRSALSILLVSKAQIVMFWGPELVALYNDAYRPVFGAKHPTALGRPARECWSEIWEVLGPLLEGVLRKGEAFWARDHPFFLERHGYVEETYFDVSYDPIRDETGGVGGVFCIVSETTGRVIGERRLRTLRQLGAGAVQTRSAEEACRKAAEALTGNPADIPFALVYLRDLDGRRASLVGTVNVDRGSSTIPTSFDPEGEEDPGGWPLATVCRTAHTVVIHDVPRRFGSLPGGLWPDSPASALVLPIAAPGQERPAGVLVTGISPRRVLDAEYRSFFELVAGHVAAAIADARAYEAERRRAEALAELDRAKTAFFGNVSHEFRTPLTLVLSPIEDGLADTTAPLPPVQRERQEVAHRNAMRLLRLVNTLLDFSRIEAGRLEAVYEPVDLAALTADLASVFRSAVEKAGLTLVVDCPTLPQPVHVDRDMWEK